MANKEITVKLVRSPIGLTEKQKATIRGLGLKKMHAESTLENTPAVRGMIKKVINFLQVTE